MNFFQGMLVLVTAQPMKIPNAEAIRVTRAPTTAVFKKDSK